MGIVQSKKYDYISLVRLENELLKKYPFMTLKTLGRSCMGKNINALKLGKAEEYALITAAFHGSEYITENVLLLFIEELCRAVKNDGVIAGFKARKALSGRGVIFVPCVNPDGCEVAINGKTAFGSLPESARDLFEEAFTHWNANIRGVDINHNFSADWKNLSDKEKERGITGPAPTRFGGYSPESEPETLALTDLCRTKNIRHATALHSQGEVIYWKYGNRIPPKSEKMAQIMATSSGYELSQPQGISVGGGFKDWFIEEFNRPGFTVEIGKGKNPLPIETAAQIYSRIKEMLMLITIM